MRLDSITLNGLLREDVDKHNNSRKAAGLLLIRDAVTPEGATPSHTGFPRNHRDIEPPDPIPNSVVKSVIADDSVGLPHVKVGHCQVLIREPRNSVTVRGFFMGGI